MLCAGSVGEPSHNARSLGKRGVGAAPGVETGDHPEQWMPSSRNMAWSCSSIAQCGCFIKYCFVIHNCTNSRFSSARFLGMRRAPCACRLRHSAMML